MMNQQETAAGACPLAELEAFADSSSDAGAMFVAKPAAQWIREAAARPNPVKLWMELWYEGEVACLFADTNVGKSIYAMQIGRAIAEHRPVLYFDFEMSDKQLQMRYTDPATGAMAHFPEQFYRVEFAKTAGALADLKSIIAQIQIKVDHYKASVVIIDNISWICNRAECGDAAGELMQMLIDLKRRRNLSILVLAHTPKRNVASPLNQNSLAGSKRIANFMDSMFAIGLSKTNRPAGRYIKQIKVRSSEMLYGETNVITGEMVKRGADLQIEHQGFANERDLLDEPDADDIAREETREEIRRRVAEGQSYRSISAELKVSSKTIRNSLRNNE